MSRRVTIKKSLAIFSLVAGLLSLLVIAPAWATDHRSPVDTQLLQDTPDRIVIQYTIGEFKAVPVDIDGKEYTKLILGKESPLMVAGSPELPTVSRGIIIPGEAQVRVNVLSSEFYEVSLTPIPSKGHISRSVNPRDVPFSFGRVYNQAGFYPGNLAELGEPYILRDHRGVVVTIHPYQYDAATNTLRVYTDMTVEVVNTGPAKINVLSDEQALRPSRPFQDIYRNHFLNYGDNQDDLTEVGDMLIICHDAWITNVQPLADYKSSIGIPTTIVGVSTIPGGNTHTAIKSYIQGVYDAGNLAFVLLVGDAAQVRTPSAAGGSADPSYSLLAGSDMMPDALVGRFSAETSAHVDTQVQRSIEYETLPATNQEWFYRGTGVASTEGPGDDGEYDNQHMDNIRADLLVNGYTVVDQFYGSGASASQVTSALNNGRGIINYCGHGDVTNWSTTGFSNSDINGLTNDGMLPFIFSVACLNGTFDGNTCFGEAWLRATNGSSPTGAIATYMSSILQSWNSPMCAQDEIVDLLMADQYFSYGALAFSGSIQMMTEYGGDGEDMFVTWHIFGDPSVRVFGTSAPPTGLSVSPFGGLSSEGPNGGPFTPDQIVYTLENHNDTSLDYEVTHSATWVNVTNPSGNLAAHSTVDVTVSLNTEADALANGEYFDTLNFVNLTDHDGDTDRSVALTVGIPTPQYGWNLDSSPGWTTEGLWAWGTLAGYGGQYGNPDPTTGHTGMTVYGYNLNGDYENYMPERHLTTTAIDCSDLNDVTLKFWRCLNVEQPSYDHAYLRISTDGSAWTTLFENSSEITDSTWTLCEYDLSQIADGASTVYLRWTMGTSDGSWQYSGWNIDDVEILGVPLLDCNGNHVVDHIDSSACDGSAWCDDCNNNGIIDECDIADGTSSNVINPEMGIPDECENRLYKKWVFGPVIF